MNLFLYMYVRVACVLFIRLTEPNWMKYRDTILLSIDESLFFWDTSLLRSSILNLATSHGSSHQDLMRPHPHILTTLLLSALSPSACVCGGGQQTYCACARFIQMITTAKFPMWEAIIQLIEQCVLGSGIDIFCECLFYWLKLCISCRFHDHLFQLMPQGNCHSHNNMIIMPEQVSACRQPTLWIRSVRAVHPSEKALEPILKVHRKKKVWAIEHYLFVCIQSFLGADSSIGRVYQ